MKKNRESPDIKRIENDAILETFGLPLDLFRGMPLLSFTGNRYLGIINHRGIRQYSREKIVIAAKNFEIQITGKELCIPSFSKDQIEVKGTIEGVGFVP